MPECSVCGPFTGPAAIHMESEQHQILAAAERALDQKPVPDWVDDVMPPRGACLLCGGPDARHRVLDAIRDRVLVGEDEGEVAEDYGYAAEFVERVAREWQ